MSAEQKRSKMVLWDGKNEVHVKDMTKDGKCSNCGQCCSDLLPMTQREVKEIHRYLKKHPVKEHRSTVTDRYDFTCPFRNNEKQICEIYEVRPEICRVFQCNQDVKEIARNRKRLSDKCDIVMMRQEFFGNMELTKFFREFMFGEGKNGTS